MPAPDPAIEARFHQLIGDRAREFRVALPTPLPDLSNARGTRENPDYLAVPGMYGGFAYWFEGHGARLFTESWCRVVGNSGQRHVITPKGTVLVAEGFV